MYKKHIFPRGCLWLLVLTFIMTKVQAGRHYDVAAYVYPAYVSDDARLRPFWPMGMGEWETVMTMQQRNPGHYWKRYPLWGYVNEADPAVMEMEINQAAAEWERLEHDFSIPYYPHVSLGWDNSPRTRQSAVVRNNTPENVEQALRKAKAYVDARPKLHPLITINSWNEWTETSYLQPDNVYGYGYLDAVKRVFVEEK